MCGWFLWCCVAVCGLLQVFDGDYYVACCSAAHVPVVPDTITLPPVARLSSSQALCPGVSELGVTFDGSGSFDQDVKGTEPSMVWYRWTDLQTGSILAEGPDVVNITVVRVDPGTYDFELYVRDNEGEEDVAEVSLQVRVALAQFALSKRSCGHAVVAEVFHTMSVPVRGGSGYAMLFSRHGGDRIHGRVD